MSQAGRGKPNRVPGMREMSNGGMGMEIPPDLVWDEDDPPYIYPCSQHTEHHPMCPGNEPPIQLDSELQVEALNEGRRWARAGMSFEGVPAAYQGKVPIPGIAVELVDILMWLDVIKDVVIEMSTMTPFEFEEKFREYKIGFLRGIREANEDKVKKRRVANSLGIVNRPPLLGPDGNPI